MRVVHFRPKSPGRSVLYSEAQHRRLPVCDVEAKDSWLIPSSQTNTPKAPGVLTFITALHIYILKPQLGPSQLLYYKQNINYK